MDISELDMFDEEMKIENDQKIGLIQGFFFFKLIFNFFFFNDLYF